MANASKAQIKANRQNAKHSTGPKTNEGKAIVSKNAVSHGAYAQNFMNEIEETHYQMFLNELQQTYPTQNPLIKAQLERFAKIKTILDRIQRTLSATFATSEASDQSDAALMDLLQMDEKQRKVAQQIVNGELDINEIINVRRVRVATELANIDSSTFTSHDDYLFHTPLLCRYLFEEANDFKIDIDKFIINYASYISNSNAASKAFLKLISGYKEKADRQIKQDVNAHTAHAESSSLEAKIHNTSLTNLNKATEIFKTEINQLADTHHKIITFNKLRAYEVSPVPLNFDQLDKLFKFQSGLQNQYSKILGELLAMTSKKEVISL
jgi:hypothetical protein